MVLTNEHKVIKYFSVESQMARWYSWLARRPVTAEVVGSSPIRVARNDTCDKYDMGS